MTATITTIETRGLGDHSYLVHDGHVAAVFDPQRDIDRVLDVADSSGVRITHVFETHVHNDYVTGGLALARRCGAAYCIAAGEQVTFERDAIAPGDRLSVGTMTIEAIATPGHTPHHLAYVVNEGNHPLAVLTGGSLLIGTVGRTDLLDGDRTEALTRAQWRSARELLRRLPGTVRVLPTHGFGSFCSSGPAAERAESTIAAERHDNVASTTDDEDEFVGQLLDGLTPYPTYYAHMDPLNRAGPFEADLSTLRSVPAHELRRRLDCGGWVVDVRDRRAFADRHLAASIGIELSDSFATYVGWLLPWGSRVTLVGWSADQLASAQRELVRIGIDRPAGGCIGHVEDMAGDRPILQYRVADFAELARQRIATSNVEIVDVRRSDEYSGRHLAGAHNVPIHELFDHLHRVPPGELWVHCSSGTRAAIAASLLERAGHAVVLVDDELDDAPANLFASAS